MCKVGLLAVLDNHVDFWETWLVSVERLNVKVEYVDNDDISVWRLNFYIIQKFLVSSETV